MDWRRNLIEASYLPVSEKIWLKKAGKSWKVVKPIKNEDGSINWFNLLTGGSWWNLIVTIIIIVVITLAILEYSSNINMFLDCFRVPGQLEVCKEAFGYSEIILP